MRNQNSRFALNPTSIDMPRSQFDMDMSHKTTFNAGELIPFQIMEVLPGDTHQYRTSKVVRMQSLLTPIMDNVYIDTYHFFVPARLCWEHWKEFMGENTQSAWISPVEYEIPQIIAPEGGWQPGTIADYMGIPTLVDGLSVHALPFRAYALICNEWFRDQNLMDPLNIPMDESTVVGVNTDQYVTDVAKGGKPFKVAKFHDYFTSALPGPQKGPSVSVSLTDGVLPVVGSGYPLSLSANGTGSPEGLFKYGNGSAVLSATPSLYGVDSGVTFQTSSVPGAGGQNVPWLGVPTSQVLGDNLAYSGLQVETSGLSSVTISDLRLAFQMQKFLEKSARGGSRYVEVLKTHFSVTSPDARLQRPEYLGGNRIPVMVNQVVQNSGTMEGSTPQGNVAGYSLTSDSHGDFIKSFTEHGYIISLLCVRYDHTYQQGLNRMWSRKTMYDYYWPVFANLGEQAILNKEIYATGGETDEEVFGYQERWAEYRYLPSRVSGEMRSNYPQSLDSWHLADDYDALPRLSAEWIREDSGNIDRVLAVGSDLSAQFFADIFIQDRATRPMPMYSIPGLIDHH